LYQSDSFEEVMRAEGIGGEPGAGVRVGTAVIVAAAISLLCPRSGVGGEVVALAGRAHGPLSTSPKTLSDS
jgi:hypothetical protein